MRALLLLGLSSCGGTVTLGIEPPPTEAAAALEDVAIADTAIADSAVSDTTVADTAAADVIASVDTGSEPPPLPETLPAALSVGMTDTCALTAGGLVRCWGQNQDSLVGDGTIVPHLIASPPN